MKDTDKFLVGIVGAIVLLVVVIFVVVLVQSNPVYQPDDSPEGVVHNYLLSLEEGDYERALTYISPCIKNAPKTPGEFAALADVSWGEFSDLHEDTSIMVQPVDETEAIISATVQVHQKTFYNYGPFDSRVDQDEFTMTVEKHGDVWKLVDGNNYWYKDWYRASSCP